MTFNIRILLKAVGALVIAAIVSPSLAGEFTVHSGKRYRATLSLNAVEGLTDNALIARKFRASFSAAFAQRCCAVLLPPPRPSSVHGFQAVASSALPGVHLTQRPPTERIPTAHLAAFRRAEVRMH